VIVIDKVSRHVQMGLLLLSIYLSGCSIWLISNLLHLCDFWCLHPTYRHCERSKVPT